MTKSSFRIYFPEESTLFGENVLPNQVAIFQDPKSKNTIIHLFNYNYDGKIPYMGRSMILAEYLILDLKDIPQF